MSKAPRRFVAELNDLVKFGLDGYLQRKKIKETLNEAGMELAKKRILLIEKLGRDLSDKNEIQKENFDELNVELETLSFYLNHEFFDGRIFPQLFTNFQKFLAVYKQPLDEIIWSFVFFLLDEGGGFIKKCSVCDLWFEATSSEADTCSTNCRSKKHYDTHLSVKKGKPIPQISNQNIIKSLTNSP